MEVLYGDLRTRTMTGVFPRKKILPFDIFLFWVLLIARVFLGEKSLQRGWRVKS